MALRTNRACGVFLDAEMDSDPPQTSQMIGRAVQGPGGISPLHLWRFQIQHLPASAYGRTPLVYTFIKIIRIESFLSLLDYRKKVDCSVPSCALQIKCSIIPCISGYITFGFVQGMPGPGRVCRLSCEKNLISPRCRQSCDMIHILVSVFDRQ
jgi:hypothetical protein